MKIKQQKQIKAFLAEEFGQERGGELFDKEEGALLALIAGTHGKTKNQMKMLSQTILPRIALYKTLAEAIDAASDGATITLLKDVTGMAVIPSGKTVTIDLSGHTITRTVTSGENSKIYPAL